MDSKLKDFLNRDDCFFIHYASNGFYNGSNPAPKISCIAVYNLKNDKGFRFCIKDNMKNNSMEEAERLTLQNFKLLFERYKNVSFIHWNMGENGFGFKAIQARAKELNINLPVLSEDNLFDLSSYVSFLAEKRLSIKQILWFNSLLYGDDYLSGEEEAEYSKKWKYDEILKSAELKVRGLSDVAKLIEEGKLKTEAPYKADDGLTREEKRKQALKLAQVREKMIEEIYEHNRKVMEEGEVVECHEKEEVFFFDFAHPIVSWVAGWWGNKM